MTEHCSAWHAACPSCFSSWRPLTQACQLLPPPNPSQNLAFFFCIYLHQLAYGCRKLLMDAEAVLLTPVDRSLDTSAVVSC